MEGERWDLQVQVQVQVPVTEFETKVLQVLQVAMEDVVMESGRCLGQFGCRTEEERSEMELRDRTEMEEPEWMDGTELMEDKSC